MGVCASSPKTKRSNSRVLKGGGKEVLDSIKQPSSTTKVIHVDGRVQEFKQPIQVKTITSQNPNSFLCSSEFMSIGTCVPHVPDEEELQLGQIYFLLPQSHTHKPLSLPDLCGLAIKASSAMAKDGVGLSSGESKIIFQ